MILHVDMDAFYAAVEQRDRPEFAGRPVIVGGRPEHRGVVAAASYEARRFGIHSAMPSVRAIRLCPHAVFLPSRMDHYAKISRQIRGIFHDYTPLVEPLSLDEAFLDVSGSVRLFGAPADIGRQIRRRIADELRLTASVGVAPNKFLAKIASDLEKPAGFVVVEPDAVQAFLDPLPVERLWGVGRVSHRALDRLGVRTIGDLRRLPVEVLSDGFGKNGEHLAQLARGIDARRVVPDQHAKSISHETTFVSDIAERDVLETWLLELTEQVAHRLRRHALRGRTVTLKVRFADFQTITRSQTLAEATNVTDTLWQAALSVLRTRLPAEHAAVRLLGVGVSGLDRTGQSQGHLFDTALRHKQQQVDIVSDEINERFGAGALSRGASFSPHTSGPRRRPNSGEPDVI